LLFKSNFKTSQQGKKRSGGRKVSLVKSAATGTALAEVRSDYLGGTLQKVNAVGLGRPRLERAVGG